MLAKLDKFFEFIYLIINDFNFNLFSVMGHPYDKNRFFNCLK